ncbi:MAG: ribosomal RNA small subunit methyltransferase A [Nitrospirae bacterium]|nr:ribosomal RNA small subunit methyltransferase A [Candidatus Manganitrophaceae bacterium]
MKDNTKSLNQAHKIRAKKKWGQNFLTDPNIVNKILDAALLQSGESVLEIGPGKGFMTRRILARGARLKAIEIDPDLVAFIQSEIMAPDETFTLIHQDALRYDYQNMSAPYKVVANLPYNISTPLLFRLLEEKTRITQMVLMLQKEVAERITASPGTKSYGALSVILQFFADVKILFNVSPHCFYPKPKVSSAVISIIPLQKPRIVVQDEGFFLKIVKGAFLYRRKQVLNALVCAGFSEEHLKIAFENMKCDPKRRGETFTLAEFACLSDTVYKYLY